MHRGLLAVCLILSAPAAFAAADMPVASGPVASMPATSMPTTSMPTTSMDVAPTTLALTAGAPGLFFVTNHGAHAVTVQIEPMDWRQDAGRDVLAPSRVLLASPPLAHIAPGARQSVRVLAKSAPGNEQAYRLLVSELPDPAAGASGVRVLLQFSVPVFVDRDGREAPLLSWSRMGDTLRAANSGHQTVKLQGLALNGAPVEQGLIYLLPGAVHDFPVARGPVAVSAHEGLSGRDIAATVAP